VFGSVARGEADEQSDIDFFVKAGPNRSSFFPGGLIAGLEEYLGLKVDMLRENGRVESIRERLNHILETIEKIEKYVQSGEGQKLRLFLLLLLSILLPIEIKNWNRHELKTRDCD